MKNKDYVIVRLPRRAHVALRKFCDREFLHVPGFLQAAVLEKIQREETKKEPVK